MGQIPTRDLVLLGISYHPEGVLPIEEREELGTVLGRSQITIKKNLTSLKKDGLISKRKELGRSFIEVTEEGEKRLTSIDEELNHHFFTPEHHFIPRPVRLMDILNTINDHWVRLFMTNLFFSVTDFDLIETLNTFELLSKETSIYKLLESDVMFDGASNISNFVHSFMESTLYGQSEVNKDEEREWNIESLVLEADNRIIRGELDQGLELYQNILEMENLSQDIWFIATVGRIKTLPKMGRYDEMNIVLEDTRKSITNKMALAYLNQIEADILEMEGETERARVLFERSIGTFRHFNHPVFLSIAYNNYGILMFNSDRYDEAEKLWRKSRRCALEGNCEHMALTALGNLASIMRLKGDFQRAQDYLDEASSSYEKMNNLEMLAGIEYNRALLTLSMNEFDRSIELFNRSLFEIYPLVSDLTREERLEAYTKEAKKYKYTPSWNGSFFNLTYNQ
jgi:tetratricopeptide (TPR) repeat protein